MASRAFAVFAILALLGLACIAVTRRLARARPTAAYRRLTLSGLFGWLVLLLLVLLVLRR